MSWKTRKERLHGDQSGDPSETAADHAAAPAAPPVNSVPPTSQAAYAFGPPASQPPAVDETASGEPDAITLARLRDPEFGGGSEREPFVLDLDNDIFRTDSRRTSLGQNAGGWHEQPRPVSDAASRPPIVLDDSAPLFGTPAPQAGNGAYDMADEPTPPFGVQSPFASPAPVPDPPVQQWAPEPPQPQAFPAWSPEPQAPAASDAGWGAPARNDDAGFALPQQRKVPSISELMAPREHEAPPPADIPAFEPPQVQAPSLPPLPESYHRVPAPETDVRPLPPSASPLDINRHREDVAAGLVAEQSTLGIPKVAPFIVDVGNAPPPAEPTGEPTLLIRFKNLSATYTIRKDVVSIGRPDSETQNYPDVEIEMDEGVSRKHAEIRRKGSEYFVVDVGSTNGSLHNGERLIPNAETRLAHGDRIRVGEVTEIIFE